MKMKKKLLAAILACGLMISAFCGCELQTEADRVSYNVSQDADNFNVVRRLTVFNLRTDTVLYEIIGRMSVDEDHDDEQLEILVEVAKGEYKKDFVKLANEVAYVVDDVSGAFVDPYHYEVNFLPEMIGLKVVHKN